MEDAFKNHRRRLEELRSQGEARRKPLFDEPVHKPDQESINDPEQSSPRDYSLPRSKAAFNRWLRLRRTKGRKGLVNILNEALVSQFGPLEIKGNITLIHEDGSTELANRLSLCRCGHSRNKPFCDGQHLEAEFADPGRFNHAMETPAPLRPAYLAVTCEEDGPLSFEGRMRIVDYLGQECAKPRGKLCRCGQSANKPFCDGAHERSNFKSFNAGEK
ncbi:MAG TPA: CDGSH iron-sulfur domain-containing protein [Xanthomonadales bacterium]|nr:CDGSH iron-sulfur domain-containing protein [Xanthomonadales bacterium]